MKRGSEDSNEVKLLTSKELGFEVQSLCSSASKGNAPILIQRYIKSIGSKAFVVRTCWQDDAPPYCFIVNNKSSYYDFDGVLDQYKYRTNPNKNGCSTIFKTKKGKHLNDTLPYIKNLLKYFRGTLGCKLKLLVADFIKDEAGIWWLVNVKRAVTTDEIARIKFLRIYKGSDYMGEPSDWKTSAKVVKFKRQRFAQYQNLKQCKYCEDFYPTIELSKKMTLKMIIQLDKHLKHRGFSYQWLERSNFQFLDTSSLYETHRVCKTCYRLYEEVTSLLDLYSEFSQFVGIPMELDKTDQLVSITTLKRPAQELLDAQKANNDLAKKLMDGEDTDDLEEHSLDLAALDNASLKPKKLCKFRLIFFIQRLEMIPVDTDFSKHYTIEIHTFDTKVRFKLDMSKREYHERKDFKGYMLTLNKMQVKYFFSENRKSLRNYIEKEKTLKVYLMKEGKRIGDAEFSLKDFETDQVPTKEFYQNFTGYREMIPFWAWDLKVKYSTFSPSNLSILSLFRAHYGLFQQI